MIKSLTLGAGTLLLSALVVAGCGGGGSGGGGGSTAAGATGTGELNVQLTDAPLRDLSRITQVNVTVEKVEIHAASAAAVGSGSNGAANSSSTGASTTGLANQGGGNGQANGQGQGLANQGQGQANGQGQGQANVNGNQGQGGQGQANVNGNQGQGGQGQANANGGQGQGNGQGQANANGGQGQANGQGNANAAGNWIAIFDAAAAGATKTYNLLDLRGGVTAELANVNLPAGKYTHMRITFSAVDMVVDGNPYSTANGKVDLRSGMIQIPFQGKDVIDVQPGQPAKVLIDFDLSNSFNSVGPPTAPTSFSLSPVLRGANLRTSGALAGVILSDNKTPGATGDDVPLANAMLTATQGKVTVVTFSDAQGAYFFPGLAEGAWDLGVSAPGFADLTQTGVQVVQAQQQTLDLTLAQQ